MKGLRRFVRNALALVALLHGADLASAGVLYVNANLATGTNDGSSWADAYRGRLGLQAALTAAAPGNGAQIWVAAGVYAPAGPSGDRNTSFALKNGVAVYAGFSGVETSLAQRNPAANLTILTGDLNANDPANGFPSGNDNSAHVVRADNCDPSALIDGFVIRQGDARSIGTISPVDREDGAGMLIVGGSPTVLSCVFTLNSANASGGGLCVDAAAPTIRDCTFINNRAFQRGSGAANLRVASGLFENCRFEANTGNMGGGFFNGKRIPADPGPSSPIIRGCVFFNNNGNISSGHGPGLLDSEGAPRIEDCLFHLNHTGSSGGGVFLQASHAVIDRCRFVDNAGSFDIGDAAYLQADAHPIFLNSLFIGHGLTAANQPSKVTVNIKDTSAADFINCTFASNGGTGGTGATVIQDPGYGSRVINCVFWNNAGQGGTGEAAAIRSLGGPTPIAVTNSCVQGWTGALGGAGNFGGDPLFVSLKGPDAVGGTLDDDLRLTALSPCIDAGSNAGVPIGTSKDLASQPRFRDVPQSPDSGVGAQPLVDVGAYEFIPTCPLDLNADLLIDTPDLLTLLGSFGASVARWAPGDFNGDGRVDTADLVALLGQFGLGC